MTIADCQESPSVTLIAASAIPVTTTCAAQSEYGLAQRP
jgi:hypothetical protein